MFISMNWTILKSMPVCMVVKTLRTQTDWVFNGGKWQTFNLYLYWLNRIWIAAMQKPECLVFTVMCCMDGHWPCMRAIAWIRIDSHDVIWCAVNRNNRLDDHPLMRLLRNFVLLRQINCKIYGLKYVENKAEWLIITPMVDKSVLFKCL